MTVEGWLALVIPLIITGIVGPWIAYRRAVALAKRNAEHERERLEVEREKAKAEHQAEGRRLDLSEWQAMTGDLRAEIARLRAAREEDDKKVDRLSFRLDQLEDEREKLELKVAKLENWACEVIGALRHPAVASVLLQQQILIPPPPLDGDGL